MPIRWSRQDGLIRPSAAEVAEVAGKIAAQRGSAANDDGRYDMVVWAEVAQQPGALPALASPYADVGATWWIETARPEPDWWEGIQARVAAGPLGDGPARGRAGPPTTAA